MYIDILIFLTILVALLPYNLSLFLYGQARMCIMFCTIIMLHYHALPIHISYSYTTKLDYNVHFMCRYHNFIIVALFLAAGLID